MASKTFINTGNEIGGLGVGWGDATRMALSMGFVPKHASLTGIGFKLSSTGSKGIKVYIDTADSNSFPTHTYKTGALYSFVIPNADLSTSFKKYDLPAEQTLTPGTQYCFYMIPWDTSSDTEAQDYRDIDTNVSNTYSEGKRAHYDPTGGGWSNPDSGNADLHFRIYGTVDSSVLYLNNAAAPYSPSTLRGAWDATASYADLLADIAKSGSSTTKNINETSTTNNYDVLLARFVSVPAVQNVTIAGVMNLIIGAVENNAAANAHLHVHAYITQGDSDTPRGTLFSDKIHQLELDTTAKAWLLYAAMTSVSMQTGDRLVVEIGYQNQNTSSTSYGATINYGGTGGDLPEDSTSVTTLVGSILITAADVFSTSGTSTNSERNAHTTGVSIGKVGSELEWTPTSGEPALYFAGPSHNALVQIGDDNAAQIMHLAMGSAIYLSSDNRLTFAIKKVGSGAQYYNPTFLPKVYIDENGKIVLRGTGTIGGTSLTGEVSISGDPGGECMYVVLDIKNNSGASVDIVPTMILSDVNLMNFRWEDVGVSGNDAISYDSTNKYLKLTSSGISNIFVGIKAVGTVQHYDALNGWQDIASILSSGDLDDTIGTIGQKNYIWVENGETATPAAIGAGSTVRFVWAIAYKTSQAALESLMAGLTSNPTTPLATADGYFTKTRLAPGLPATHADVETLYGINMGRLNFQAYSQTIDGFMNNPAGSYTFTFAFGRDGYYSVKSILQIEDGDLVAKDEYLLFKDKQDGSDQHQQHEIAQYVNASGRYITWGQNGTPGDQDAYQILKAYEYYVATQDATFLSNEISNLNGIYTYLQNYYTAQTKWNSQYPGHGNSTYLDGDGNITGSNPMHDPVMSSLVAYAMYRLAELNTIAGNTSTATAQIALADAIKNNFDNFWNSTDGWPYFNVETDGTLYDNIHLTKVDAVNWGIMNATRGATMATKIVDGSTFWDNDNKQFRLMPTTDDLYNAGSYWYGNGWNMVDFKALETVFRFGTAAEAKIAWEWLRQISNAKISLIHGFMAEKYNNSGIFGFSIGGMNEMLLRGIFGIDAHADYFTISPNTNKLELDDEFTLTDLRMGGDLYTVSVTGHGSNMRVYQGGVLLPSNVVNYGGDTDIVVEFIDGAIEERGAKITGKDTSNSERAAVITGKDTSNSERAATLTGKDTANSERAATITGKDTANSERAAVVTGKDTSNAERGATMVGTDTASSERSGHITGKDTSSSERGARLSGESSANEDERGAKIAGQDSANSERAGHITGKDTANAERGAKTTGQDTSSSERGAKTKGQDSDSSEVGAHTTGKDTAFELRGAKLVGADTTLYEIMAHLWGKDTAFTERGAHMTGKDVAFSERGARIVGRNTRTKPLVVNGGRGATVL